MSTQMKVEPQKPEPWVYKMGPDGMKYPYPPEGVTEPEYKEMNKYGYMWLDWMKENHPKEYMLKNFHNQLRTIAGEVSEEAMKLREQIEEELKKTDPLPDTKNYWNRRKKLDEHTMMAEEIVYKEVVYQMH